MSLTCEHCELPVAPGERFCCPGCAAAFELIQSCDLGAYYEIAERAKVDTPVLDYAGFDEASFLDAHAEALGEDELRATLALDGIRCAACVWLLERLPRIVSGVVEARAHWSRSTLTVTWRPSQTPLSAIAAAVAKLGYRPHVLQPGTTSGARVLANRRALIELGVAFAAAGNNMLIAISLYFGMFGYMSTTTELALRWASGAVGLASLLWPGRVFFVGAIGALRTRTPHMDLPVALGLFVGGLAGVVNLVRGHGEIYFDTLSVLVFLLLLGRYVQSRQQQHAADAVEILHRLTPRIAHRYDGGVLLDVPAEVLRVGDRLQVRAGETIPADATVLSGQSAVDESILTGETRPREVTMHDTVAAGSLNLGSVLDVRIDAVREHTRIGRILSLVESSARTRPRIVQLADRIGAHFVVTVIVLAALTFAGWLFVEPGAAVDRAVSLLVVACPCALALATPLALSVALSRAARRKILIKGGDVLQRLSTPGTIWLDKTGTVTEGRTTVAQWAGDESVQAAVAALERESSHPVALALQSLDDTPLPVANVVHTTGAGIEGTVDGHRMRIGTEEFVAAVLPHALRVARERALEAGLSPVFVARDGQIVAVAGIGDPLRPEAVDAVRGLQARGWVVGMLSGDHPAVVTAVGQRLGIPAERCRGGLDPEEKVASIQATVGPVVMVGDGVNDSAALAAASVGIATRNGAEASLEAAPVYLGRPGVGALVELLDGSRATMATIRRNFGASIFYNAFAVGLATAGLISPLVAAILMPISSLTVVSLSLALRWPRGDA